MRKLVHNREMARDGERWREMARDDDRETKERREMRRGRDD